MIHGEFTVAAAALNGKPQRLVVLERKDGTSWRDNLNTNSARSRKQFVKDVANKLRVNVDELVWLDDAVVRAADEADAEADVLINIPTIQGDAQALLEETPEAIKAEAQAMLESPDLIDVISSDIESLGVVGERALALTIYVAGVSRLLDKPLSAIILGSSSTGKSYVLERVTALFPPESIVSATTLTPQALYYMPEGSLVHRFIVVGERSRRVDDDAAEATRALREMQSSGRLRKFLSVRVDGQWTTQMVEQEGPIAYAESTTLSPSQIFTEDVNRSLLLSTDERPQQTARIIASLGKSYAGQGSDAVDAIVAKHHAAQRMLRGMPIVIPFAGEIAREFTVERVEARRGFPHLMNAVRAVVLLHQFQRLIDGQGRLIATPADFWIARDLVSTPLGRLLGGQSSDAAMRFLERLQARYGAGKGFSTTDAAKGESSKRSVQNWLVELCDFGAVENLETSRGNRPATWRILSDQPPSTSWALPDVASSPLALEEVLCE